MYAWRVTKYDPALRSSAGAFKSDDWTDASDIGSIWSGQRLELGVYLAMEDRYVSAALQFLSGAGLSSLTVRELEPGPEASMQMLAQGLADILDEAPPIADGQSLSDGALQRCIRLNLRALVWCKLEAPGRFYLHFGHDYYMYVGSDQPCSQAVIDVRATGLFVEDMKSPYLD